MLIIGIEIVEKTTEYELNEPIGGIGYEDGNLIVSPEKKLLRRTARLVVFRAGVIFNRETVLANN